MESPPEGRKWHDSRCFERDMMRYIAAVTVSGIVLLAAWAFAHGRHAPQPPLSTPENAVAAGRSTRPPADSVRIEQQLVRVEAVAAVRVKTPRPELTTALTATRNRTRRVGFLTRARRVLFGQGRHKPAPFPTVQ